jgi:hypothetical protein
MPQTYHPSIFIPNWQDRWIPNQSDFKVWSPLNILSEDALVETLIDSKHKTMEKRFDSFML